MSAPDVRCPACRTRLRVAPTATARKVRCSRCDEEFTIPAAPPPEVEEAEADDAPPTPARRRLRPQARGRRRPGPAPGRGRVLALAVGVVLLGVGGVGAYFAFRKDAPQNAAAVPNPEPAKPVAPANTPADPKAPDPKEVLDRVKGSTVYVRAQHGPLGLGTGTGFFAGPPGYVVTNAHVVGYGPPLNRPADRVEVVVASGEPGERTLPATIFAADANADLALLRVEARNAPAPLTFGRAADLVETQELLIFGYPYGELLGKNISVNRSTVSSLRREGGRLAVIQIAGGMHPGNSGGPVTDARGRVVGVSVARLRGAETIAFAIPCDVADGFVRDRINSGGGIDPGPFAIRPDPPTPVGAPPVIPAPKVTGAGWALRLPAPTPAALAPAPLAGDSAEVELSSPAAAACVGGGGRFLILHLPADRHLAVFDATRAAVVRTIPVASPAVLFAAGSDELVVVDPGTRAVERWSLTTFGREATGELPTTKNLSPVAVAMGSESRGPLLVQAVDFPRLGERFLFDVTAMREVPGTRTGDGLVGAAPRNVLRAAPDGLAFTLTSGIMNRSSFLALGGAGVVESPCPWFSRSQPPLPSGDGDTVLGPGDAADRTGKRVVTPAPGGSPVWHLPAAHGPLHLVVAERPAADGKTGVRVTVHPPRDPNPLFVLPALASIDSLCDGPPAKWQFDQSVFLVPGARLLAVLPKGRDRLSLHRVDVDARMGEARANYLFVATRPPAAVPGHRFEYPIGVQSSPGGVKFRLAIGPPGMAISPDGRLTWDVPAGLSAPARVVVTISNAAGQSVLHRLELMPAAVPGSGPVVVRPPTGPPGGPPETLDQLAAADKYPLRHDAARAKQVRDDRLGYYRTATTDAFEKGPGAKAPWAAKARAALDLHARRLTRIELSGAADPALDAEAAAAAREALAAGCDDPLIRYLVERPQTVGDRIDPKIGPRFRDTVAALHASSYGDFVKLYAAHNWLMTARRYAPDDPVRGDEGAWITRFRAVFERVAAENTPSGDYAVLEIAGLRETPAAGRTRRQNYEETAAHLAKAGKALRLVYEAEFLRRDGWDVRGAGLAATVTPEAGKVFAARLATARVKLEEAWAADQTRPPAPTDMVTVCRDLGLDRATTEAWFARSLDANPDNRVACLRKFDYLQPKWHGTQDDYLAFGWMLATAENVEGQFPLVVLDMYANNAPVAGPVFAGEPDRVRRVYSQPPVWATFRTAAERVLQASPGNTVHRTLYARAACLAGKLDVAHAQFEKLGDRYAREYFPEPGEYERWVGEAKKAAGKK